MNWMMRSVGAAGKLRLKRALLFQVIEIFEEEQPAGLLDVVELGGTARLFPQDVVDIPESLFEHAKPPRRIRPARFSPVAYETHLRPAGRRSAFRTRLANLTGPPWFG